MRRGYIRPCIEATDALPLAVSELSMSPAAVQTLSKALTLQPPSHARKATRLACTHATLTGVRAMACRGGRRYHHVVRDTLDSILALPATHPCFPIVQGVLGAFTSSALAALFKDLAKHHRSHQVRRHSSPTCRGHVLRSARHNSFSFSTVHTCFSQLSCLLELMQHICSPKSRGRRLPQPVLSYLFVSNRYARWNDSMFGHLPGAHLNI